MSKETVSKDEIVDRVQSLLVEMQSALYNKALKFRDSHITEVETYDEFKDILENKTGFVSAFWDGTAETEEKIKNETKATIRCIPLNVKEEAGTCVYSGEPAKMRVLFAKAY